MYDTSGHPGSLSKRAARDGTVQRVENTGLPSVSGPFGLSLDQKSPGPEKPTASPLSHGVC